MITERVGDLLDQTDLSHIAHQANLFHTFGAGLALQIARRFPYAEEADKKTKFGTFAKLGTYSVGIPEGTEGVHVFNLYSQDGFGKGSTDYVAMRESLNKVGEYLMAINYPTRLGIPWNLGCGIAGGSWPRVYGIIESVFGDSPIEVVICRRPEDM